MVYVWASAGQAVASEIKTGSQRMRKPLSSNVQPLPGWQAGRPLGLPAPQGWKSFDSIVGQTLSSVNPEAHPILHSFQGSGFRRMKLTW
jgi:hypothetical protein